MLDLTAYIIRGIEFGVFWVMAISIPVGGMCVFWRYSGASKPIDD